MDVVKEIVFVDEFLEDVGQHDVDVLWSVELGLEVEVIDVKGDKRCALPEEDSVEHELDEAEGRGLSAGIAGIYDVLAGDGDASAVGVELLRSDVANDLQESNTLATVGEDVLVT